MGLGRSTYYYRSKVPLVQDQKEEADLWDRIEQIVVEHARYGYRRVTWQLKREGWEINCPVPGFWNTKTQLISESLWRAIV